MSSRVPGVVLAFAVALTASESHAQSARVEQLPPAADDEAAIQRGVALRKEQRDEDALAEFRSAYALRPSARARAQIALAEQALGRWAEAESDLTEAMRASDDDWIVRNRDALAHALDTIGARLGTVEITTNVAGAELSINGRTVGTLPRGPVRVAAGSVLVEITADGYAPARRSGELEAHKVMRETLTLAPLVRDAGPTSAAPSSGQAEAPVDDGLGRRGWGVVAFVAAGVTLGAGIAGNVVQVVDGTKWNDNQQCPEGQKEARCGDVGAWANRGTVIAVAGYVSAGLLTATGLYLVMTAPSASTRASVAAAPLGSSGVAVSARVAF